MAGSAQFRLLPQWIRETRGQTLQDDLLAGLITAVLLVPQGMALAMLAGLPPMLGLYAGILPPILYAILGSSRTLAVGPVSVAALLVANALAGQGLEPGDPAWIAGAVTLALLCAGILLLMALLRMGELTSFLSHPVLSGFTSGAAVVIILSQLPPLLGSDQGDWLPHAPTLALGLGCLGLLALSRSPLQRLLRRLGIGERLAMLLPRAAPLLVVLGATLLTALLALPEHGVDVVGDIPGGLPSPVLPGLDGQQLRDLLPAAIVISLVSYVESVSVARVLAWRRRQRIDSNRELLALGIANAGAAVSGTMPVAGGFARSKVNFDAGARTQFAGIVTALLVALAALLLAPLFKYLPLAALAAVIIIAVLPLIDLATLRRTWRFDRADSAALLVTFFGVVLVDIELGLLAGLVLSLAIFLWRTGHPHFAVIGRIPGSSHYRNVDRYEVETWSDLLLLRIDESLYFANTASLEQMVARHVADRPDLRHVVLICSAVNRIDHSALETLEALVENLGEAGLVLHLAEVKGPVMDRLRHSGLLERMHPGQVFLSPEEAVRRLHSPERAAVRSEGRA
ncbi:sulfate permease [Methylonatrum kenyense]|uniref:SulP family inorganic anion transporter n=1 Tax=Methylonatrum kenyense TaxID=455253 RepID=UPI0020BE9873|nr:sulfate permease [Methylonatrum kenyense]MCK8517039.1 sulfate permease [Methylonatrum kenyense]